jgi:hypothetical protein
MMAHRERGCEDERWMELARLAFMLAVPAKKKKKLLSASKIGMDAVKSKGGYKLATLPRTVTP